MKRYRTILVPTDLSAPADRAFAHALALAGACGARLRVVHVVPIFEGAFFEHVGAAEKDTGAEAKLLARLEARVRKLVGRSRVRYSVELAWGDPPETLVRMAGQCDMIVLGARGHNPWQSLLIGSVAERVARHAPVPVLIVNQPPARRRLRAVKRAKRAA